MQQVHRVRAQLRASVASLFIRSSVCAWAVTAAPRVLAAVRPAGRSLTERFPVTELIERASEQQVLAYGTAPLAGFAVILAAIMVVRMVHLLASRGDMGMAMRADVRDR